jgi:hypothetical protein
VTSVTLVCAGWACLDGRSWETEDAAAKLPGAVFGLGDGVGAIEEKSDDFFEGELADVNGAVDAIGGLDPVHFTDGDVPWDGFATIAEFDVEEIAAEDHGHAVKGIVMPRRGFARRELVAPDQVIAAMMQNLLTFRQAHGAFLCGTSAPPDGPPPRRGIGFSGKGYH